jgi:hypothetical protein
LTEAGFQVTFVLFDLARASEGETAINPAIVNP